MYWLEFELWGTLEAASGIRHKLLFRSEEEAADYVDINRQAIRKHSLEPGGIDGGLMR